MTVDRKRVNEALREPRQARTRYFTEAKWNDQPPPVDLQRMLDARDQALNEYYAHHGLPQNWDESRVDASLVVMRDRLDVVLAAAVNLVAEVPRTDWANVDWGQDDEDWLRDLVDATDGYFAWRRTGATTHLATDVRAVMLGHASQLVSSIHHVLSLFDDGLMESGVTPEVRAQALEAMRLTAAITDLERGLDLDLGDKVT